MDTKMICEIVAWITAREDIEYFFQDINVGGIPSEIFFEFCANYNSIWPYPKKRQEKVPDGCRFVYWTGPEYRLACGAVKAEGSNHCRFHSQPIFSEKVLAYLEGEKKRIDEAFKEMGPALLEAEGRARKDKELMVSDGEESDEEGTDDESSVPIVSVPPVMPEPVKLTVKPTSTPGQYREEQKGLIIQPGSTPNGYICIGWSQELNAPIQALTPELVDYCKSLYLPIGVPVITHPAGAMPVLGQPLYRPSQ